MLGTQDDAKQSQIHIIILNGKRKEKFRLDVFIFTKILYKSEFWYEMTTVV